jgi:hypothetical protein
VYGFLIYDFDIKDLILKDTNLITICYIIKPNSIIVFNNIDKVGVGKQGITKASLLKAFNKAKMRT